MNIKQIVQVLIDAGIEPNEANAEVKLLVEHFCNYSVKDILMGNKLDSEKLQIAYEKAQLRAKTRQPIQHIIGWAYFMGDKFIVNKDVLIPRDETEFLAQKAIDVINNNNFKTVLDVGTGSGCIACEIAQHTQSQVIGLDISSDALMIALNNATGLNLNNRAIFRKSNLFSNVRDGETFDVIVSNPPYIPKGTELQIEVTFDPAMALFTEDTEGLDFYRKITQHAPKILNNGGYLMFELGVGQSKEVRKIMAQNGFLNIEITKDLAGIDRVITGMFLK